MTRFIVVGTVVEAIEIEESSLGRKLPPSFRDWLLNNNSLDLNGIRIFPVREERDTRKTWESLAYTLQNDWAENVERFSRQGIVLAHLLPFADCGTHDYYCFDYSVADQSGECSVVLWSYETGLTTPIATTFAEFKRAANSGKPGNK